MRAERKQPQPQLYGTTYFFVTIAPIGRERQQRHEQEARKEVLDMAQQYERPNSLMRGEYTVEHIASMHKYSSRASKHEIRSLWRRYYAKLVFRFDTTRIVGIRSLSLPSGMVPPCFDDSHVPRIQRASHKGDLQ